jgi:TolB protein
VPGHWRGLADDQVARLWTFDIETGTRVLAYETADRVIEAPNWSPDGSNLVFNAEGRLVRLPIGDGAPEVIDSGPISDINNDHVLGADGASAFVSNGDGHLYEVYFDARRPRRISNEHPEPFIYFLHGISPDGQTLLYTGAEQVGSNRFGSLSIFAIPTAGGRDTRLTSGEKPADGAEYSPDGEWIYFNSEMFSEEAGHAQVCRMRPDGSDAESLTSDERVNWFPHLSPDGRRLVYLSFPPGTVGHPADKNVILREMHPDGGDIKDLVQLFGGQGTINVNSWAPDSRRFAFVDYEGA